MMAWVRIDDGFPDHPKALEAGPLACWLYVCGIAYSNRYLTDGFIPERQVSRLSECRKPFALASVLVSVGLWERVENGYQIHDYLEYQNSAEKVRHEREQTRKRVERFREKESGRFGGNAEVTPLQNGYERSSNGVTNGVSNGNVTTAPIKNPIKKHSSSVYASADSYPDDFEAFWSAYPRKRSKGDAFEAWQTLRPSVELQARMLAAIEVSRRSDDWREERGKYVPYPASWLRAAGWLDVPEVSVEEKRASLPVP